MLLLLQFVYVQFRITLGWLTGAPPRTFVAPKQHASKKNYFTLPWILDTNGSPPTAGDGNGRVTFEQFLRIFKPKLSERRTFWWERFGSFFGELSMSISDLDTKKRIQHAWSCTISYLLVETAMFHQCSSCSYKSNHVTSLFWSSVNLVWFMRKTLSCRRNNPSKT